MKPLEEQIIDAVKDALGDFEQAEQFWREGHEKLDWLLKSLEKMGNYERNDNET